MATVSSEMDIERVLVAIHLLYSCNKSDDVLDIVFYFLFDVGSHND